MTLNLSFAPTLTKGIPESCKVVPNGIGESSHFVQARSVRIVQPRAEFGRVSPLQDAAEAEECLYLEHLERTILPTRAR